MERKDRKVNLTYQVTANQPYFVGEYMVEFDGDMSNWQVGEQEFVRVANDKRWVLIREGMQFDADVLNQERQRVAQAMRRRGYFYFDQELLYFAADSNQVSGEINVKMRLKDNIDEQERVKMFRRYKVAKVHFHVDYDPARIPKDEKMFLDSKDDYIFTWVKNLFVIMC